MARLALGASPAGAAAWLSQLAAVDRGDGLDADAAARELACRSFMGWLQVGALTGMRPGELDGLQLVNVDYGRGAITVSQQYNATSKEMTAPKNGLVREAILTPSAREARVSLAVECEWAFTTMRGGHYTLSARAYHRNAIRASAG